MAITNGYVSGADLESYMAATAAGWSSSGDVERAIETASRDLDAWCGRRFYADDTASERTFYASGWSELRIDDALEVTGLVIDGTTVTLSDYDLLPLNGVVDGLEGWPTTTVALPQSGALPQFFRGRCVVTAKWGWETVPTPVETACLQLAAENLKMGEAPFGVAGIDAAGTTVRIGRLSPQVRAKLQPYRRGRVAVPVA